MIEKTARFGGRPVHNSSILKQFILALAAICTTSRLARISPGFFLYDEQNWKPSGILLHEYQNRAVAATSYQIPGMAR